MTIKTQSPKHTVRSTLTKKEYTLIRTEMATKDKDKEFYAEFSTEEHNTFDDELYKIWLRDYQDKELPIDFDAERTANIVVKSTMHDWLVVNSERFGYLYRFKDI